jgi:hypothetical protein
MNVWRYLPHNHTNASRGHLPRSYVRCDRCARIYISTGRGRPWHTRAALTATYLLYRAILPFLPRAHKWYRDWEDTGVPYGLTDWAEWATPLNYTLSLAISAHVIALALWGVVR